VAVTPNFGLELFLPLGVGWREDATAGALLDYNMILIDAAIGAGSSSVFINATKIASPNFNNSSPAAPVGNVNVTWQVSGSSVSGYVPVSSGDVTSVNGQTAIVVLSYSDVGADPAGAASTAQTNAESYALGLFNSVPIGFVNPMSAHGDIIYENASLGPTRLPIGVTGQALEVIGGQPAWVTPTVYDALGAASTAQSNAESSAADLYIPLTDKTPTMTFSVTASAPGTIVFLTDATFAAPYFATTDPTSVTIMGSKSLTVTDGSYGSTASVVALDVSTCAALHNLNVNSCADLLTLDASGLVNFTSLDVGGCSALTTLTMAGDTSLAADPSLYGLSALAHLDVSGCTALSFLSCYDDALTFLDVTGCTVLSDLECNSNQLTSLDVSTCTALQTLDCDSNQLTSLDVSTCTALQTLVCGANALTSLDVSTCTALSYLECAYNQLTSLDISTKPSITYLDASYNAITSAADIDAILLDLIIAGLSSGTVNLSGGTNATPSNVNFVIAGAYTSGDFISETITQASSGSSATWVQDFSGGIIVTAIIGGSPDSTGVWTDGTNTFQPTQIPYDYSDYLVNVMSWTVTN